MLEIDKSAQIVLDIGCGIRPQTLFVPQVHICADPHKEYLEHLPLSNDRVWILLNCDWAQALQVLFSPIDTVFLLDVIEHLDKAEGLWLLSLTQERVRKQIIIYTPHGYLEQKHPDGKDAWGFNGGKWQEHKSGWTTEDFGAGWVTNVLGGIIRADNKGTPLSPPRDALEAVFTKG